ncbi:MAG: transcription factor E [Candidatus Hydrothermarchaeales archaeon]
MDNGASELNDPEIREFLEETIGEEGLEVVRSLLDREVTDEELAEETGLKLNIVRKILYKLYDYRLASYVRVKDKEIGWYIYTWKLDLGKTLDVVRGRKRKILKELTQKLEYETSHVFFSCNHDNSKIPFDIASECNFKCPQCNGVMEFCDNQNEVMSLEEEIERLRQELKNV